MPPKPGCVLCRPDVACAVHQAREGELCPRCHGTAIVHRAPDGSKGRIVTGVCGVCAGTGLKDHTARRPRGPKPEPVDQRPLIQLTKGEIP